MSGIPTINSSPSVGKLMDEYADIFNDKPGRTNLAVHSINLKPNVNPIRQQPYRANPLKMQAIKKEIDDMLSLGVIRESSSPWSSPILLVDKPDGSVRFCVDYRKVNAVSNLDSFPIPRIEDLVERVAGAKFISKLDISKAYWQIELDQQSIPISAFCTPFGLYEFEVMPFGLGGAASCFQRLVQKLLRGLESFSGAYQDDIVIYSENWEDHLLHLSQVFERIRSSGLTVKRSKCVIANAQVIYLGHVVGSGSITPIEAKVEAILNFPNPTDKKQLRQFLGVIGYYRRYIPNMSQICAPLTNMLKKDSKFVWNNAEKDAFLHLKSVLASKPVLSPPDFSRQFIIYVDASQDAIGGILGQLNHLGEFKPVCYLSKRLNSHQTRYSTIEKELFALLTAVRTFGVYFGYTKTKVYTDHNPLVAMASMKNQNRKILRWILEIQEFQLDVQFKPGKENTFADMLSRPSLE